MSQDISLELNPPLQSARTVGLAFAAILMAHVAIDMLAALVPSTLGLIEARLQLTTKQSAWLFGLGPLCSGLAQPICALVSDRWAPRQFGVVGLALGVLGIGAMSFANDFVTLAAVYVLGVIGIGIFHPIGAATIGHLWPERRTAAVSWFFVAGMLGGVLGSLMWPRVLSLPDGFRYLPLIVAPLLLLAIVLQRSFAGLEPLPAPKSKHADDAHPPIRWALVAVLYVGAALRFCVNTALIYLFLRSRLDFARSRAIGGAGRRQLECCTARWYGRRWFVGGSVDSTWQRKMADGVGAAWVCAGDCLVSVSTAGSRLSLGRSCGRRLCGYDSSDDRTRTTFDAGSNQLGVEPDDGRGLGCCHAGTDVRRIRRDPLWLTDDFSGDGSNACAGGVGLFAGEKPRHQLIPPPSAFFARQDFQARSPPAVEDRIDELLG